MQRLKQKHKELEQEIGLLQTQVEVCSWGVGVGPGYSIQRTLGTHGWVGAGKLSGPQETARSSQLQAGLP